MRIDEKKHGVLVVTFTREQIYWWQVDGKVDATLPGMFPELNDDHTPKMPDSSTGPIELRFRANRSQLQTLTPSLNLALAVLCGDSEGARILADMVLLGDTE